MLGAAGSACYRETQKMGNDRSLYLHVQLCSNVNNTDMPATCRCDEGISPHKRRSRTHIDLSMGLVIITR